MFGVSGLPFLLIASVIIGLGHLLVMVGQQTFVAHVSSKGSSDSAFGTLTAAASVGQLIGPPAVTLVASLGGGGGTAPNTDLGLLVCIGFSLLATPAFFFLRRTDAALRAERRQAVASRPHQGGLYRTPGLWRSLAVSGAVLVTVDLMYAFVPVWATEQDVSATAVGLLLALRAAVSLMSRVGLTRLINRFGRKVLLLISIVTAVASLIALPLVGPYGAIAVMIGLGIGLWHSAATDDGLGCCPDAGLPARGGSRAADDPQPARPDLTADRRGVVRGTVGGPGHFLGQRRVAGRRRRRRRRIRRRRSLAPSV